MDEIELEQRRLAQRDQPLKSYAGEIIESRRKISPRSYRSKTQPHAIDKQLVHIIKNSSNASQNKLSLILKSRGLQLPPSAGKDGLAPLRSPFQNRFFSEEYQRQQLKFIRSEQKQHRERERIRRKLKGCTLLGKPFHDLNRGSILYFEKNSIPQSTRGRYHEMLHPLCGLYQKQAERTLRSRLRLADPFVLD